MKTLLTIAMALLLCCSAFASTELDEYCTAVSDHVDKLDLIAQRIEALAAANPSIAAPMLAQVAAQRIIGKQLRRDACLSPDLATAKAAVARTVAKGKKQTDDAAAAAKKSTADMRRKQAAE